MDSERSRRRVVVWAALLTTALWVRVDAEPLIDPATRSRPAKDKEIVLKLTATIDLGKDVGQSFGSLFEGRNAEGRVVIGAGFTDIYNTRFRSDRHAVQFFVRPAKVENAFTTEFLPRPTSVSGMYMFDLDGKIYTVGYPYDKTLRFWNPATRAWEVSPHYAQGAVQQGADALVRVGQGILKFAGGRVTFDDRIVLEPPDTGSYYNFYYGQGRLIFYHTLRTKQDGFNRLYACPWTPEQDGPADLSKACILELTYLGEFPFAYGQLGKKLLTCSNMGGIYVFDGETWSTLLAPIKGVSYQVYSMINHYDRLLMGQYPTGELFEYDGEKVSHLKGWPPRIAGVLPSARESQTTMIYRGDLFVGVWPWGEVWRYDADAKEWVSMGRMFRLPPVTDKFKHPFEQEICNYNAAHGTNIVYNNWGQRVTSMAPLGADLMLSTSAKGPLPRDKRFAFLTDEVWEQYGRVIRLMMPGNLSAPIQWKDGPTQLEFVVRRNGMSIVQDGVERASAALDPAATAHLRDIRMKWGYGIFGPFQGLLSKRSVE